MLFISPFVALSRKRPIKSLICVRTVRQLAVFFRYNKYNNHSVNHIIYGSYMENNEVIKSFRDFQKKSRKHYKKLLDRIKNDKKYLNDNEWDKEDIEILGSDRSRNKLNVVKNAVRTIVNTYRQAPYKWKVIDSMLQADSKALNSVSDKFLAQPDNITATLQALENAVSFGLGVLVISNDIDVMGNVEPVLYSIRDLDQVYLDADISKLNGSDAEEAAIVELKNKNFIQRTYGIDITTIDKPEVDIDEEYDRKEYAPVVTYYKKANEGVEVYKLVGNDVIETILLPLTYIPVVPVFGETVYDDDEFSYTGVVSQMKPIQKLINYAYSNILVRLASSPKNTWLADSEAIEGMEKYYKDSNKTLNPLLIHNSWSPDGKRELPKPERINNEIQLGDVGEMFSQSLQMVNSIIGIPAVGLETETEKTATEVLTAEKVFNNNVRAYMYNLRASLQVVGLSFVELLSQTSMYGQVKIEIIQGPDEGLKKQEARVVLQSMQPLLTEPQDQRKLLIAMCNVESDNEYITQFGMSLQPMPTEQEMKDQELINQADSTIKQLNLQVAELQKQLEDEKRQSELKSYSLERELAIQNMKHQQEMEKMLLQHRLDGELTDKDLVELSAETQKNEMELEKKAIELDNAKQKANAENIKTASQIALNNSKFDNEMAKQETIKLKNQKQRKEVENG